MGNISARGWRGTCPPDTSGSPRFLSQSEGYRRKCVCGPVSILRWANVVKRVPPPHPPPLNVKKFFILKAYVSTTTHGRIHRPSSPLAPRPHPYLQLIRDELRASTGADGNEWWRGGGDDGIEDGTDEQEEAHMDNLEDYVELLYEGKDKVCAHMRWRRQQQQQRAS